MARPAQIKTNHQTFDTEQASWSAVFLVVCYQLDPTYMLSKWPYT